MVQVTRRSESADRSMAAALQQRAAAFKPRLSHAGRIRGAGKPRRSGPPSDGAERCGNWGLRAPPRRTAVPQRANQGSNLGGRLKLNVVRRNRAGQYLRLFFTPEIVSSVIWLARAVGQHSAGSGIHKRSLARSHRETSNAAALIGSLLQADFATTAAHF